MSFRRNGFRRDVIGRAYAYALLAYAKSNILRSDLSVKISNPYHTGLRQRTGFETNAEASQIRRTCFKEEWLFIRSNYVRSLKVASDFKARFVVKKIRKYCV